MLFGDSVGVQDVVDLAARFPERVDRLVLKGPTPDPAYRSPAGQYSRVLMNMPFEAPLLNLIYQVDFASAGIPRMVQQLRRTVDDPIETKLPNVQAPALRGRNDQCLSQAWAEQVTRLLPDGRLIVVEGAAHNVHYSAPEVTARVIAAFLEGRLTGPGAGGAGGAGDDVVVVPPGPAGRTPSPRRSSSRHGRTG